MQRDTGLAKRIEDMVDLHATRHCVGMTDVLSLFNENININYKH